MPNGELLSGLPLPDIRGTMGTFYYFATDLSRYEEGNTEFGGILKRLVMEQDVARSELIGPPNPIVRSEIQAIRSKAPTLGDADRATVAALQAREDVRLPLTIRWNRSAKTATVEIQGQSLLLEPGKMSRWIDLEFRVNFLVRLHGMAQLLLMKADNELQLYISPVNWKPDAPPLPISSPASFAGDLFQRLGYYRTLGWAEATWPLNEGRMDERTFMEDLYKAFDDRGQVILSRVDARNWDLLVGVVESTDRVQHMMWRLFDPQHPMYDAALAAKFGDSILRVYRRADQLVGEVLERIDPGTTVLVVSDHGFHSWRKSVNLNTWLVQQGYMVLQSQGGQAPGEKKLDDLFGGGEFWENVDWSRTRAYAMGLGQIYFNLRGREARGIVSPGAEAKQLADELGARLLTMTDPDDGARIVRSVYQRDAVYAGEFLHNASELQVGMEDGYRVSWQTTLGGSPPGIVYANMKKWSGDHGGYDFATTAGVLISNKPFAAESPSIMDIAPTVLKFFGVQIPGNVDGKSIFARTCGLARSRSATAAGAPAGGLARLSDGLRARRSGRARAQGADGDGTRQRADSGAAARGRSARDSGEPAPGRAPEARARASDQSRRDRGNRPAPAGDVSSAAHVCRARRSASQDRGRRSARHRSPSRAPLYARPRRLLAAAARRRRPAIARPRLPNRGGDDASRS